MSSRYVSSPRYLYDCDGCGKTEETDGTRPEGWTSWQGQVYNIMWPSYATLAGETCPQCTANVAGPLGKLVKMSNGDTLAEVVCA